MRTYEQLTINEKIHIKQIAINLHGKRIHYAKPNELKRLDELQVNFILSENT